jgi:dTDP-4-amino-4,6-dideoxygalactose transaminase
MIIKFQDQPSLHKDISKSLINKFKKKLIKSDFILGDDIKKFESNFAKYCNTKYAVGVSNGTDALNLALRTLNLKKDDEVIIPAMTYIATALGVIYNGCKLRLCDISLENGLINVDQLKKSINKKTKCIIVVNFNGNYVDLKEVSKVVPKKIKIIFDASQSHGCGENGKKANSNAFISCYSLYPGKNLGALGDAGIITTNNALLYKKLLKLRNIGSSKKFIHDEIGFNNRLDTIQAAFLNIKLQNLDKQNNNRRKNANFLNKNIKNKLIKIVQHKKGSVYHNYVVLVQNRKKLIKHLEINNVQTNIHYPFPINKHKALKKFVRGRYFNAEKYAKECVSIPIHPLLKTSELKKIVQVLNSFN